MLTSRTGKFSFVRDGDVLKSGPIDGRFKGNPDEFVRVELGAQTINLSNLHAPKVRN